MNEKEKLDARGKCFVAVRDEVFQRREVATQQGRTAIFYEQEVTLLVPGKELTSMVSLSHREEDELLAPGVYEVLLWPAVSLGGYGRPEINWRDVRFEKTERTKGDVMGAFALD